MTIKVKNNKISDDTWVGQFIAVGDHFEIPEYRLAQWKSDSKVSTDIGSGDLEIVKSEGPFVYYSATEAQKIYAGTPDVVLTGGQGYEFLCTNTSGVVVWNPGTVTIQEEGVQVGSVPFNTLNFIGSDITATDAGSGQANITVSGGGLNNVGEDTTPQLGGMLDINGNGLGDGTNLLLDFVEDASSVNYIQIENEATGGGPIIRAVGSDTNISLIIDPKGTGNLVLDGLNWPTTDGTNGQVLTTDGLGVLSFSSFSVFGSEHQEAESLGVSTTTGSTWKEKLEILTGSLPSGKYRIGWYYEWQHTGAAGDVEVRLQVNNTSGHMNQLTEPWDLGTDQWLPASGFVYKTALSGINTIELDYRNRVAGTMGIRKARLEIWRIS